MSDLSAAVEGSPAGGVAWLFPGQGSQVVGMGRDLFAEFAPAREALDLASALIGRDLAAIVARGPDELLTRTDVLQPALTAVTVGCCLFLRAAGLRPDFVAGHSLGEFAALFAAGVIGVEDTMRLVAERGRLMHEVAVTLDGGMLSAGDIPAERVEETLRGLDASAGEVAVANYNAPTQVAVCGPRNALGATAEALAAAGAKVVPLNVSGPWHSRLLAPAAERFAALLDATPFHDAAIPVALNATGALAHDAATIRETMRRQLCSPVRWHAGIASLHAAGAARFIELGPKKVLRGLLRHIPETASSDAVNFDGPKALRFVTRLYDARMNGHAA